MTDLQCPLPPFLKTVLHLHLDLHLFRSKESNIVKFEGENLVSSTGIQYRIYENSEMPYFLDHSVYSAVLIPIPISQNSSLTS